MELPQFNWSRANKLLPEKTEEQKRHNDMRNKAESIAVLQRMRTETHKAMMTRERKLASTRKKGKVDIVVNSFNAKSLKNKQSALRHAMGKRKIDVCVINEVYAAVPPNIRGYSWFQARDDRPFRGTIIYVSSKWAPLVTKIPDIDTEMDMEMIHLRVNTLPTLNIIGAYLDTAPTAAHAVLVQTRLEEKMESLAAKGEDCLLIGDLNRPMDKPTELQKTRLMKAWIDTGKVQLLNDPNVHTRIDPVTGRGSTLDLGIINPSLKARVEHFKVDTYRRWSLHGTITSKSTGRIQIGKWSDHKGIECKLKVTILAATKAGNSPVINYAADGGWDRYHKISNSRAPDIVKLIDEHQDVDLRQTALNLLKLEIDIKAFGIRFRPKGISHKKQTKRKQSHLQDLEDIIRKKMTT